MPSPTHPRHPRKLRPELFNTQENMFTIHENGVQMSATFYSGHRYEGFYSLVAGSKEFPTVEEAKSLFDREHMRHGDVEIKNQEGEVVETIAARQDSYAKFAVPDRARKVY